jgi:hypothetical protein
MLLRLGKHETGEEIIRARQKEYKLKGYGMGEKKQHDKEMRGG